MALVTDPDLYLPIGLKLLEFLEKELCRLKGSGGVGLVGRIGVHTQGQVMLVHECADLIEVVSEVITLSI
jgi:hypothetical protein